ICSRTELLLAILGGLFVLITMSVVIQVGSFRLTGKRVFRMAPLQHHFELKGWSEVLVVVRFWIIQGICVIVGLGLFYAGWAADKCPPPVPRTSPDAGSPSPGPASPASRRPRCCTASAPTSPSSTTATTN